MTIQEEMHKRFNDILRQYDNEVNRDIVSFSFRNVSIFRSPKSTAFFNTIKSNHQLIKINRLIQVPLLGVDRYFDV